MIMNYTRNNPNGKSCFKNSISKYKPFFFKLTKNIDRYFVLFAPKHCQKQNNNKILCE